MILDCKKELMVEFTQVHLQRIVISDDFVTEKNHKPLIDYFIQGINEFWLRVSDLILMHYLAYDCHT